MAESSQQSVALDAAGLAEQPEVQDEGSAQKENGCVCGQLPACQVRGGLAKGQEGLVEMAQQPLRLRLWVTWPQGRVPGLPRAHPSWALGGGVLVAGA